MNEHPSELTDQQLLSDCEVRRQRRSGPGGQHRNKVETAVVLTHRPSGVQGEASERRSQLENRQVALKRLRVNLALSVRTDRQLQELPSPRWAARTGGRGFRVNPRHEDFPPLLAEALDVVASLQFDVVASAKRLGISTSQMVRFLKLEPRAISMVNGRRQALGERPLR